MLWYSLEVPHWGTSNEYLQQMLLRRNKKNINNFWQQKKDAQKKKTQKKMSYLELCIANYLEQNLSTAVQPISTNMCLTASDSQGMVMGAN